MPDPIIELELYLVRHGESRSNAGLLDPEDFRAFEDPFLTEKGVRQAQLLGEFYSRLDFDCILASGQNRALQTAGEVAARQIRTRSVEAHPLFTEGRLASEFGEKHFDEIAAAHPFAIPAQGVDPAGGGADRQPGGDGEGRDPGRGGELPADTAGPFPAARLCDPAQRHFSLQAL